MPYRRMHTEMLYGGACCSDQVLYNDYFDSNLFIASNVSSNLTLLLTTELLTTAVKILLRKIDLYYTSWNLVMTD